MHRVHVFFCALCLQGAICAATDVSDEASVFVDTTATSFWRTGVSPTFDLPIAYPPLASAVDISVRGVRYAQTFPRTSAVVQPVSLPEPTSDAAENVYEITLAFDDGTTNACSFALVRSQSNGGPCPVRLTSDSRWHMMSRGKVMPIPYGCSLSIDGIVAATGLDGAQGWFVCPQMQTGEYAFVIAGTGDSISRTMRYVGPGIVFVVR